MKDKSRTILRALFCFVLSGVVVIAISLGVLWLKMLHDDRVAHVEIQKRLEAIRNAGQPLTAQDLANLYPDPPPEHDAVLLLKPALAALVVPKDSTNLPFFGGDDLLKGTAPLEKPVLGEMQAWVNKNQKAFDSVPLEQLRSAWIGCSYTNGFTNLVYAPISKINPLVKLFCMDATMQAEFQHPKEAAQSLQKALAIGNTWRNDFPIHGMSRLAAQDWVSSALERILNRTVIANSDLVSISASLTATNLGATKEFELNERCMGLFHASQFESLADQEAGHSFTPVRFLLKSYQARTIYRDQDLLNYLESDERSIAVLDLPLSNAIPTIMKQKQDLETSWKSERFNFLNIFKRERFSFLKAIEPQSKTSFLSEADIIAQVRVTRTALAVERWRLAYNGNVPKALAELVPDFLSSVPNDPFDERPLRYKKLAHGYVVYSIGPDFTDDGGKEKAADAKESDHYDITFTVER
jgi:hypothetical protein